MILHFSHIGLTDGRTFMIPFGSRDPATPALAAARGCRYRSRTCAYVGARRNTIAGGVGTPPGAETTGRNAVFTPHSGSFAGLRRRRRPRARASGYAARWP